MQGDVSEAVSVLDTHSGTPVVSVGAEMSQGPSSSEISDVTLRDSHAADEKPGPPSPAANNPARATAKTDVRHSAILILGMHRSGTSALSRVLNLMGMNLGQDLLPPAADNNETGFWEHRILQWINRRIFEAVGREWDTILPMPPAWQEMDGVQALAAELKQVLSGEFGQNLLWGVKDPRVCFLLPLWKQVLDQMGCQPRCVLTFRNPIEVAKSLQKRDRLPASQCHLMWLRSQLEAERNSRGMVRTLTMYPSLLQDWKSEVQRIGRDLDIAWPVSVDSIATEVEQFLRPSLRHHQVDNQRLLEDDSVPEPVRRAYAAILKAAETGRVDELSDTFDVIADELSHNHPMVMQFVADVGLAYSVSNQQRILDHQNFQLQTEESRQQVAATGLVLQQEQAAHAATQNAHAAAVAELEQARAVIGSQQAQMTQLAAGIATVQRQAAEIQAALAASQAALVASQSAQIASQAELVAAQSALITNQAALVHEQNQLAAVRQQVVALDKHAVDLTAQFAVSRDELLVRLQQSEQAFESMKKLAADSAGQQSIVQAELLGYREQRTALLSVLRQTWQSRSWRWTSPLRSLRKILLTEDMLIPSSPTPLQPLAQHRWQSQGPANFILPCMPVQGKIKVSLKMRSSTRGDARLYFDTGKLFNDRQRFDLGEVSGELDVQQVFDLPEPVFCFRFDPVQTAAEFWIERFEIQTA